MSTTAERVYMSRRGKVLWATLATLVGSVGYTVIRAPYMPDPAAYLQSSAYLISPICLIIATYMGGKSMEKSNANANKTNLGGGGAGAGSRGF